MEKTQGIRYSHASQPIEATGAALCPYSETDYAQFCSFKDKENTGLLVDLLASHIGCRWFAATLAKILRYVLRNSLIRSASFVRSLDCACVTDTLQHST